MKEIPYRYRVFIFLFFLIFVTILDRSCIGLLKNSIEETFHFSETQMGYVFSAFALSYALVEFISGAWGDRIGQRAVFIRIVLWWSLFTALTGFASGFFSLLLIRFLFGMGESGAFPTSSAVISKWFPASETSKAMSSLTIGATAGAAVAPLIVLPVAAGLGWRASFFVNGSIGLIWVIVCVFWFRNNPSEMKRITPAERKLIEENRRYSNHNMIIPWKKILGSRSLIALSLAHFFTQWSVYFLYTWLPPYLTDWRHFSGNNAKYINSLIFLPGIASNLLIGFLCERLVKLKGLRFGRLAIAITALCMLSFSFFVQANTNNNVLVVILLMVGIFFQFWTTVAAFSTCIDIGGNYAGTVAGIMNTVANMGPVVMPVIAGHILDATHKNYTPVLYVLATVSFAGALLWLLVDPRKKLIVEFRELKLADTAVA
jgi:sugar phosphate permease